MAVATAFSYSVGQSLFGEKHIDGNIGVVRLGIPLGDA